MLQEFELTTTEERKQYIARQEHYAAVFRLHLD